MNTVAPQFIERELNSTVVQPTINDLWRLAEHLQQKDEDLSKMTTEAVYKVLLTETIIALQKINIAS